MQAADNAVNKRRSRTVQLYRKLGCEGPRLRVLDGVEMSAEQAAEAMRMAEGAASCALQSVAAATRTPQRQREEKIVPLNKPPPPRFSLRN